VLPVVVAAVVATAGSLDDRSMLPVVETLVIIVSGFLSLVLVPGPGFVLDRLYRRLGVTTWRAYGGTGLVISILLVAGSLWWEWDQGYETAPDALHVHLSQIAILLSGPIAAMAFWLTARPDLADPASDPAMFWAGRRLVGQIVLVAACGGLGLDLALQNSAVIGFAGVANDGGPGSQRRDAVPFKPGRSQALVRDLDAWADSEGARLDWVILRSDETSPQADLQVTILFADPIVIEVRDREAGTATADLRAGAGVPDERVEQVWSRFLVAIRQSADRATALPAESLPVLAERGEAGRIERPW